MNINLCKMTNILVRRFFDGFANDPSVYADAGAMTPYVYSAEAADAYWQRQQSLGRIHLAVMLAQEPIGEVILKRIDRQRRCCTLSIHLKNDSVKNCGYGTAAEILTLHYAFDELGMETVYADALQKNTRSRRVLEKAGFQEIHVEGVYHYYICNKAAWIPPELP